MGENKKKRKPNILIIDWDEWFVNSEYMRLARETYSLIKQGHGINAIHKLVNNRVSTMRIRQFRDNYIDYIFGYQDCLIDDYNRRTGNNFVRVDIYTKSDVEFVKTLAKNGNFKSPSLAVKHLRESKTASFSEYYQPLIYDSKIRYQYYILYNEENESKYRLKVLANRYSPFSDITIYRRPAKVKNVDQPVIGTVVSRTVILPKDCDAHGLAHIAKRYIPLEDRLKFKDKHFILGDSDDYQEHI